jgi:prolyl-tRNA synthetase
VEASHLKSFFDSESISTTSINFAELGSTPAAAPAPSGGKTAKPAAHSKTPVAAVSAHSNADKNLIGIDAKKNVDFPNWYQQVLTRTEMMDYYDISGCYIIRPWAYKIWKEVQSEFFFFILFLLFPLFFSTIVFVFLFFFFLLLLYYLY